MWKKHRAHKQRHSQPGAARASRWVNACVVHLNNSRIRGLDRPSRQPSSWETPREKHVAASTGNARTPVSSSRSLLPLSLCRSLGRP
jgi:hypothetical protein